VARSSGSRWLWLGGGFIAVAVALLGVAATFDTASKVPYSYWTSVPVIVAYILFGLSLVRLGCASREVPFPYPISRRGHRAPRSSRKICGYETVGDLSHV
jgi:hypothetical protein